MIAVQHVVHAGHPELFVALTAIGSMCGIAALIIVLAEPWKRNKG